MTLTTDDPTLSRSQETFDSLNPATGAVVGTFAVHSPFEVHEMVDGAHPAAAWWWSLGFDARRSRLLAWKRAIVRSIDDLAELIHVENGKTIAEATLEILGAVEVLDWAADNAKPVLGPRKLRRRIMSSNVTTTVEYRPYGVIGVIGTWNWPVFTSMGAIACALAAGNAVVYKPSELTPSVGIRIADLFREVVPEYPVMQVVTGLGDTGRGLCTSSIGKLSFVGSEATGRRVMAACAANLTPVLLELGGKDALIVDDDADVDAAAAAAAWAGLSNSGQTCIAAERVYATAAVYDRFVAALTTCVSQITAGGEGSRTYGPMDQDSQVEVVRRHVTDALGRGARAVVGGPESIRGRWIDPIVLVDVPEDAPAITEETFGPTIVVTKVADINDAVKRANASPYGLGAAVFSKKRGREIAARLHCGMTSVNSVMSFALAPGAPFGGVGASGFGRIQGADGLREFSWVKTIATQQFSSPVEVLTFDRRPSALSRAVKIAKLLHGRG